MQLYCIGGGTGGGGGGWGGGEGGLMVGGGEEGGEPTALWMFTTQKDETNSKVRQL